MQYNKEESVRVRKTIIMGSITRKKVSESELGKTIIMCSITRKKVSESELGKITIMCSITRKKVSESYPHVQYNKEESVRVRAR